MQSIETQRKPSSDVMIDSVDECLERLTILVGRAGDRLNPVMLDNSKLGECAQSIKGQYPPLMETVLAKCSALNTQLDKLENLIDCVDL